MTKLRRFLKFFFLDSRIPRKYRFLRKLFARAGMMENDGKASLEAL
jgi:hypothetical protein